MLMCKGLLSPSAHPGDDALFLLQVSVHLLALVHRLVERLSLFSYG